MRRTLHYFLLLCVAVASCSEPIVLDDEIENRKMNGNIEQAITFAEHSRSSNIMTKSDNYVKVDRSHIYYILDDVVTKSSHLKDTLMYILNFEENNGFAVVSVTDAEPQLICVTQKGFYDGTPTGLYGFDEYITQMVRICKNIDRDVPFDKIVETKSGSSEKTVRPFIPVSWHQNAPFNWYCSYPYNKNIPAGCVAVAIAQSMSAYKVPESISLTYSNAASAQVNLDWDSMISHNSDACEYGQCDSCNMKAFLLREIGQRVDMAYAVGGSGANTLVYAQPCLRSFGFQCDSYQSFSPEKMTESLDAKCPIIVRARNSSSSEGHAWNIDGYRYTEDISYQYYSSGLTSGKKITEKWYFYFKYGWAGINDGLYLSYRKDTASGSFTATGNTVVTIPIEIFTDNNGLNYEVKIFTNIKPVVL